MRLAADITGGPCREYSYVLHEFHLHWGDSDSAGSEHYVNGLPTAAEVYRTVLHSTLLVLLQRQLLSNNNVSIFIVSAQPNSPALSRVPANVSQSGVHTLYVVGVKFRRTLRLGN